MNPVDIQYTFLVKFLVTVAPFFVIAGIVTFFRTPYWKGKFGEWVVNYSLKKRLSKDIYTVFKSMVVEKTKTKTTQIDHIVLSEYGIFVVETKNMKGRIYGKEEDKSWRQGLGKVYFKFQNPIKQNYKHIKYLMNLLNVQDESIFKSVIVFIGDSTFKTEMPKNVTHARGGAEYILTFSEKIVSPEDLEVYKSIIEKEIKTQSLSKTINHNKNVKTLSKENEALDEKYGCECHKCGEEMVVRTVRKGQNKGKKFLGCSTFPKCRARKDLPI